MRYVDPNSHYYWMTDRRRRNFDARNRTQNRQWYAYKKNQKISEVKYWEPEDVDEIMAERANKVKCK